MAEIKNAKEAQELMQQAREALIAKDYTQQIVLYNKMLELMPNDDDSFTSSSGKETYTKGGIYTFRGTSYGNLKQLEKAFADFDKAISLDPKNYYAYYHRSFLYLEDGEMEKAKADIEKAVELNPKEAGSDYNTFAKSIRNLTGDKRTAAVYYKKSVEHGDFMGMSKSQLDKWGM